MRLALRIRADRKGIYLPALVADPDHRRHPFGHPVAHWSCPGSVDRQRLSAMRPRGRVGGCGGVRSRWAEVCPAGRRVVVSPGSPVASRVSSTNSAVEGSSWPDRILADRSPARGAALACFSINIRSSGSCAQMCSRPPARTRRGRSGTWPGCCTCTNTAIGSLSTRLRATTRLVATRSAGPAKRKGRGPSGPSPNCSIFCGSS